MFTLFEEILCRTEWKDANELKENYKKACQRLIMRDRLNFVVRNCAERMLKVFKQTCYELKIELKDAHSLTTIHSLRHLTVKKIASVHDDSSLSLGTSASFNDSVNDNPFDNVTPLDLQLA